LIHIQVLFEQKGEFIAQFKFTAVILPTGTLKLSENFPLPHVTSQYDINQNVEIQRVMALPLDKTVIVVDKNMEVEDAK